MYITYKHKGTEYHVAACMNCKASMTMTDRQFHKLPHAGDTQEEASCLYLFGTLGCCDNPLFLWAWEDKQS